jgi:hypothetical protein
MRVSRASRTLRLEITSVADPYASRASPRPNAHLGAHSRKVVMAERKRSMASGVWRAVGVILSTETPKGTAG